ncbi:MAG: peptide chain release factor 2 [Dehalococcoidales bacterium]|nr:peptide chain release factor 2 [Dehalococcoidales bacterium]MDD4230727.1 peptide chain release factor 2 [Dehalococcoidales bacterium]MDD4465513.1 peptide chain release factor 2 [Dehalococcoidales bacterium]MDD5402191.1 peptide chain release factor 2 [Dehalococcoidales bacterium]
MSELTDKLVELKERVAQAGVRLDSDNKKKEIALLEKASLEADFWQDTQKAKKVMQELAVAKSDVARIDGLKKQLLDIEELLTLEADNHPSLEEDLAGELEGAENEIQKLEFELSFSGTYDRHSAVLYLHAGAGGTESQDWAEMLMRMYLRWAEKKGYKAGVLDISPGDEAGIKSATVEINGNLAYGYLKSEHGVHRLVRLSPFDFDHGRHTSFALVEVLPEAEEGDIDITLNPDDLKIDTFRSSGPGGQNMQKVSSAVRVTHLPTGIVVSCQSERSQYMNKETAFRILRARLLKLEIARRQEEMERIKGEAISAAWGNQIRSYILHPYKMVKDHRIDFQMNNPEAVLEGELDELITAYLRSGYEGEG